MSSDESLTGGSEPAAESAPVEQTSATESNAVEVKPQEATPANETTADEGQPQAAAPADAAAPAESDAQPAAESEAAQAPASPGDDSTAPAQPQEEARRKPVLNPTADPGRDRAVPTVSGTGSTPASTEDAAAGPAAVSITPEELAAEAAQPGDRDKSAKPPAVTTPKPASVEIPRADLLSADLEAQIDQVIASGAVNAPPAQVEAPAEGDEDDAAAAEPVTEENLEPGARLQAKIQSISGENVFLDVGLRSPGVISRRQFEAAHKPEVGQRLQVVVDKVNEEEGLIHLSLRHGVRKVAGNWDSIQKGQLVDCMVIGSNKGGLEVNISNLRGFLPASQVELGYVEDLAPYAGQKLRVKITEVNPKKRNLVVSRRAWLEEERKELEAELWKKLEVGQKHEGRVKTIKDYGAFIDIGGVDGFLHIGEISWTRIRHPEELLSVGQQVEVQVVSLDEEKKRIGLGMRQLTQNPWAVAEANYASGSTVSGRVTRTTDFGAFVELEPGLEGLVHISELDHQRVRRVTDVVQVGSEVQAQVLEVDPKRRRISLSLKALTDAPVPPKDEDLAPGGDQPYQRQRKGPLKGGRGAGETSGGGLFGNPSDFT